MNEEMYDYNVMSPETIMLFDIEKVIIKYEKQLFSNLVKKDFFQCEENLSDFCFEILELSDEEQLFVAKTFFISIITDIIRVQARKEMLHPKILSYSYRMISKIESWKNITEYLLAIPWFIEQLKTYIIAEHLLFNGCVHVEKALQLINHYLVGDMLSVKWLAQQIGISTTHLCNLFKLQLGTTISKYIAKRRIEEITYELTHTNHSLKTIREKYGFSNHSHFIQHFKKIKGVTPLQYIQELIH